MKRIIGRKKECELLEECLEEDSPQLIVVYGRRRVGKTFLINQYFDNHFAFKLTGAYNESKKNQLKNFAGELKRLTNSKVDEIDDWIDAFWHLRNYLTTLPRDEKQVVFFDEMPWLDTKRSGFFAAFEWFWNDFGCTQDNLVVIVCGSATSWMVDHIDKNKGGLFNRHTCKLYLHPFKLADVKEYLESKGFMWSYYDIVECYMILGGIPYYLKFLRKKLSLAQNIDRLFFEENAALYTEFDNLYATLFSNSELYIKMVEILSRSRGGLTRSELLHKMNMQSNGTFTKMLTNLIDSGFVRAQLTYGKKKKDVKYQLGDYYTAFYLHFVKGNYGHDDAYWSHLVDHPTRRVWEGLTFEQVCKDHIQNIKHALGISGVLTKEYVWSTRDDDEKGITGAQIDLLIERRDQVINLCEIKFSRDEFIISKDYDRILRNKISSFMQCTNSKYSLQLTMITTYGVKRNMYSGFISNQLTLDDMF